MMPKLYEYIMDAELVVHPNTPNILVRKNEYSLFFHNKTNRMDSISYEAILLDRIGAEFVIYQDMVTGTEITDDFDAMNWFQI